MRFVYSQTATLDVSVDESDGHGEWSCHARAALWETPRGPKVLHLVQT